MMAVYIPFSTQMRAAAMALLVAYKDSVDGLKLQTYPGRPATIKPPTAFPDRLVEQIDYSAAAGLRQRTINCEVLILWGLFDSKEAVDQRDAFVDGFMDWVTEDRHAAGSDTTIGLVGVEDVPTYVPDWIKLEEQRVYFATRLTLQGYAGG